MHRRISIALLPLVAAVALAKDPPTTPTTTQGSSIVVYRPGRYKCSDQNILVIVDDMQVGRIQPGRYLALRAAPGMHTVRHDENSPKQIEVKAGQATYVRFRYEDVRDCGHERVSVVEMAPDEAQHDVSGLKASDEKYVYMTEIATPPEPTPPTLPPGSLEATIMPGAAQLYLDDEPKGVTSEQGRLVLKELKPGAHTVRVDLPGYKELTKTITITAGETYTLNANLQRKGPDPFTEQEIEDGLQKGVTTARMKTLVEEIGVAFTMNDDVEKRLRAVGADGDLILAIMKNKK